MKKLICIFIAVGILFGCNNKDEVRLTTELNQTISIYSGSKSNFDRAYMLANAFSSNDAVSILAIGIDEEEFTYTSKSGAEIKVVPNLYSDFSQLSQLIVENSSDDKKFNLFISSMDVERNSLLSDEAFSIVDEIYVVIEGTASLGSSGELLDSAKAFYQKAIKNGVKSVQYVIWDSVKEDILIKEDGIGSLAEAGIGFHFVNFNKMKEKIDFFDVDGGLISAAIYTGAISKSIVGKQIFETSNSYSQDKETIVLFGSYTANEPNVSFVNQVEMLKRIEDSVDLGKYNIVFKGHPREVSVNDWINNNSNNISYFLSFPYEIWQVIGQGYYVYHYGNVKYNMYLPKEPSKIYSVFSSTLYGEDASKIISILGYNKLDEFDNITNFKHDIGIGDVDEYNRWGRLTGNTSVPFLFTYDFIKNQ